MITYAEMFLFVALIFAVGYAFYWKAEAQKSTFLFKLMLTNKDAREKIVENFEEFRRQMQQ
jgi:hypothetical protein